ncbi:hypothetical protein A2U01_0091324, partial [Trifolium medium]|nr:hypothetical protein [Trifolium medium]
GICAARSLCCAARNAVVLFPVFFLSTAPRAGVAAPHAGLCCAARRLVLPGLTFVDF